MLREEVGGAREIPAEGDNVRELLDDLMSRFPALRSQLVRNDESPACPDCGEKKVQKQFSVFAAHGTSTQPSFGSGGGCCGGSCGCGGH